MDQQEVRQSGGEQVNALRAITRVNIRALHDHASAVLHEFPAGILFEQVGSERNGYTPVRFNGGTGWVKSAYVEAVMLT
jgi:hypothetical protein